MSVLRPDLMMKCVVPVVMAGIIAVSPIPIPLQVSLLMSIFHFCRSTVSSSLYLLLVTVRPLPKHASPNTSELGTVTATMSLSQGFIQLGAGLSVGLAGLAAGFAIGIVGDAGVRGTAQQPRLYVGMILILIFAEVLGLYGLIVALIMNTKSQQLKGIVCFFLLRLSC